MDFAARAMLQRLVRRLPILAIGLTALAAVAVYASTRERPRLLRLSVVGHWAPAAGAGPVRLGRGPEAELRLYDPLVDRAVHAELDGWKVWNRSATQRLAVDGTEITELALEADDRFVLHVPASAAHDGGLRALAAAASARQAPGTRPVEVSVRMASLWQRLRDGELLVRRTLLHEAAGARQLTLDPLATYELQGAMLVPGLRGFVLQSASGGDSALHSGQSLALGGTAGAGDWRVSLALEAPRRLVAPWPLLSVRDGGHEHTFPFGDRALELGDWGRIELSGTRLRYRDLGQRAALDVLRAGGIVATPGLAAVRPGSVLKLGHTRYRLERGPDGGEEEGVRLEIEPRGQSEMLASLVPALASRLPTHYDEELFPVEGASHLSSGTSGQPGEAELTLRTAAPWERRPLALLRLEAGTLRVRALSELPVLVVPASGEPRVLPRRSQLRSAEDVIAYEQGERLAEGDRLRTAGVVLQLRRPDDRALTAAVAAGLFLLLGGVQAVFFLLHRPRPLRLGGKTRVVYGLDPTSTRVRAVGQKVVLPSLAVPNLLVPVAAVLTMAGMMLQLRFWLDPALLGTADFFLRQLGALLVGLTLFLALGLRRPPSGPAAADGPGRSPLGIDRFIWLGMLFLMLTNLLTAAGIGSRHNGFFFRIPGIGLTIQFSAFAKIFFAIGFARMFAYGLQCARGSDALGIPAHQLGWRHLLGTQRRPPGRSLTASAALYSLRKVVFLSSLLGAIFGFYTVQNDLGPGLIFTLSLTLFVAFVMGQYNRGLAGFLRFAGPQGFLMALVVAMLGLWLVLPSELQLPDGPLRSVVAPVLDKVVERLNLWWEPWRFTRGEQVVQSLWTVSGTAGELRYFSNLHSDFAFSAAVHHYGSAGGALFLGGFAAFFASALLLARALFDEGARRRDARLFEYSFTVVMGCLILVVEAAIHMGACLNFSPLTGVTLPFVSSGGTSIIVSYALLGVLCSRLGEDARRPPDEASGGGLG
jgi:cell division protein FtsW (lipid II flippase)